MKLIARSCPIFEDRILTGLLCGRFKIIWKQLCRKNNTGSAGKLSTKQITRS